MPLFQKDDPELWVLIERWMEPGLPLFVEADFGYNAMFFAGPFACSSPDDIRSLRADGHLESLAVARNAFLLRSEWDDECVFKLRAMVESEEADWMLCSADAVYPEEIAEISSGSSWAQIMTEFCHCESQATLKRSPEVLLGKYPEFPGRPQRLSREHMAQYPDVAVIT